MYDDRTALLGRYEAAGHLLRFRMPDDRVQAVIAGVGSVEIGPGHLSLAVASAEYDDELVCWTVSEALAHFVEAPSTWEVRCSFLQASRLDYDVARRAAIEAWLGPQMSAGADDVAVLVDGCDAASNDRFQYEVGVVTAQEAIGRVSGEVGRLGGQDFGPESLNSLARSAPEVATFAGWHWTAEREIGALSDVGLAVRADCMSRSSERSKSMHKMYDLDADSIGDPKEGMSN